MRIRINMLVYRLFTVSISFSNECKVLILLISTTYSTSLFNYFVIFTLKNLIFIIFSTQFRYYSLGSARYVLDENRISFLPSVFHIKAVVDRSLVYLDVTIFFISLLNRQEDFL